MRSGYLQFGTHGQCLEHSSRDNALCLTVTADHKTCPARQYGLVVSDLPGFKRQLDLLCGAWAEVRALQREKHFVLLGGEGAAIAVELLYFEGQLQPAITQVRNLEAVRECHPHAAGVFEAEGICDLEGGRLWRYPSLP